LSSIRRFEVRGRTAFTLIELLVVVAIISLLIAILLPSLHLAREQAKLVKCLAHMRGAGQATHSFASERNGLVPLTADEIGIDLADNGREKFIYGTGRELLSWPVTLAQMSNVGYSNNWDWGVRATSFSEAVENQEFIKDDFELVTCPGDAWEIATPFFPRDADGLRDVPGQPAPAYGMSYWGKLSFAINEDITGTEHSWINLDWPACWRAVECGDDWCECIGERAYGPSSPCFGDYGRRLRGRIELVEDPSNVLLLVDGGPNNDVGPEFEDDMWWSVNLINSGGADGPYLGDAIQYHGTRIPTDRHPNGKIDVLYADGHGGTVEPVEWDDQHYGVMLPLKYSPRVRVSPYRPAGSAE